MKKLSKKAWLFGIKKAKADNFKIRRRAAVPLKHIPVTPIKLAANFCLEANSKQVVSQINAIRRVVLQEHGRVFIDFSEIEQIDAAAITGLRDEIVGATGEISPAARRQMQSAIVEALGNTLDHAFKAESDYRPLGQRAWVTGYTNAGSREASFLVFDQGAGIPRTLEEVIWESIKKTFGKFHEGHVIKAASQLYRTGTGTLGRGRGFRDMKRLIANCPGSHMLVVSNRGTYVFRSDGTEHVSEQLSSLGGTLVQFNLRFGALND